MHLVVNFFTQKINFQALHIVLFDKMIKYGSILISRIPKRGGKIKHAHIYCIVKTLTNYNIIEYSLKLNLEII